MNEAYVRRLGSEPLTSRAVTLRNGCLGALARSSSQPAPTDADLVNLPSDVGLREAWTWWSARHTPPTAPAIAATAPSRRRRRSAWSHAIITIVATAALLLLRASPLWGGA